MKNSIFLNDKTLCVTKDLIFSFRKGKIILRDKKTKSVIKRKRFIPLIFSFKIFERIFRLAPRACAELSDKEILFSYHGGIYTYSAVTNKIIKEFSFLKGMNNPLSFCIKRDDKNKIEEVLFGEYIWNDDKGPVSIYRRTNGVWVIVYTFKKKTIKHIHNIIYNKFNNTYLIFTGDSDSESGIWISDCHFKKVEPFLTGKQLYRTCFGAVSKDSLYYVTDSPLEQNWLVKVSYSGRKVTSVEKIFKIPGPCIFGIENNDCMFFSTSVEGDPTLNKVRYRFGNKLGHGVSDRYVHILRFSYNSKVSTEVTKFKKDCLPMWVFQFGDAQFLINDDGKQLLIIPIACKKYDGKTINVNIDGK
jgi:hypothetical protein